MENNFIALDVETANFQRSSICQIGLVIFHEGKVSATEEHLLNPEQEFLSINVNIHGINEEMVKGAATFPDIYPVLKELLTEQFVVTHSKFDPIAIFRATERYKLPPIKCEWLDSLAIAKKAWPQFPSFKLDAIADELDIDFIHHCAAEDARCAGEIILRAVMDTGISIGDWINTPPVIIKSAPFRSTNHLSPTFNKESYPEVVFTGTLSVPRREAEAFATKAGYKVTENVRKTTAILVTGLQDLSQLNGHEKSSKLRRAEELKSQGCYIEIMSEADFVKKLSI